MLRSARRRLATLLLPVGAIVLTTAPVYEASTELFVSTKQATDGTDLYSGSSFSQQRVKSYTEIVTTPPGCRLTSCWK